MLSGDSWRILGQSSKLSDNLPLKLKKKSEQQNIENCSVEGQFHQNSQNRNDSVQNPPNAALANMILQSEPNYPRSYQDLINNSPRSMLLQHNSLKDQNLRPKLYC